MPEETIFKTSFTIKDSSGDEYEFKIPTPLEQAALGIRARDLRRQVAETGSDDEGLDPASAMIFRGMALFEKLLIKSTATWPWAAGKDGKPVVDIEKFGPETTMKLTEVTQQFNTLLFQFHLERSANRDGGGQKGLDGQ